MSIRTERLGAVLKRDLGEILQRDYQHGSFITVTNVEVTDDLLIAKVYISIMAPGRDKQAVFDYIEDNTVEIRKKLASKIRNQVRRIPELIFRLDTTAEHVNRMEELFNQIREEREERDDG